MGMFVRKLYGVAILLVVTVVGAMVVLFTNPSALKEIPSKSVAMIRHMMQ